jgi:hypothetical protein
VFTGCQSGSGDKTHENKSDEGLAQSDSTMSTDYVLISPGEIFEYIFFEELQPDPSFVNPYKNAKKYLTSTKMSLNLGVYTTDFIYLNACNNKTEIMNYYKAILEMAPKINIYSGTEERFPERIQKNFANHDSLSELSKLVYYRILDDLQQEGRKKTYSLIAGGVIVESVYLAIMNVKKFEDFIPLTQKIFDQKEFLNNTYDFIASNKQDKDVTTLLSQLEELKQCFEGLKVNTKDLEVSKNDSSHLKVEGGAEIKVSAADFEKLKSTATRVRNEIVSDK